MEWIRFSPDGPFPEERRYVLVAIERRHQEREDEYTDRLKSVSASVIVGYLRYAAGDPLSPYFVVPGLGGYVRTEPYSGHVTHWCDCLNDDFYAPVWPGTTRKHEEAQS